MAAKTGNTAVRVDNGISFPKFDGIHGTHGGTDAAANTVLPLKKRLNSDEPVYRTS